MASFSKIWHRKHKNKRSRLIVGYLDQYLTHKLSNQSVFLSPPILDIFKLLFKKKQFVSQWRSSLTLDLSSRFVFEFKTVETSARVLHVGWPDALPLLLDRFDCSQTHAHTHTLIFAVSARTQGWNQRWLRQTCSAYFFHWILRNQISNDLHTQLVWTVGFCQ